MSDLRRLCVFCGSSAGESSRYLEGATALGRLLAEREIELVYGGGRTGMMGRIADATLDAGGSVVGVIPRALVAREVAHPDLSELHVVGSMHERKATMAELAQGFVALPGGLGTLEELCEVLTWAQLGLHDKPCGLLNVHDFFRPLIGFLDHQVREGFLARTHRRMLLVEGDPANLLARMERYEAPEVPRWIEPGET